MRYTPGLSTAVSRTFVRIIASCASLVGCFSSRAAPRVILVLTLHAHRRGAAVDGVRRDELGTASSAGQATASIGFELVDESTALSTGVAVVAKARAPRLDRFPQNGNDRITEQARLLGCHRRSGTRRVDARAPERFVRVDVADACDLSLLH